MRREVYIDHGSAGTSVVPFTCNRSAVCNRFTCQQSSGQCRGSKRPEDTGGAHRQCLPWSYKTEEQPISAESVDSRGPGRWLGALSCRGCLLVVLNSVPRVGSTFLFVNLTELRMIHDNTQHLLVDERRLRCGVAVEVSHSGKVNNVRKWYSRNNWSPWCLKEAAENAVQVCVGWADRAFLHGLTTSTDGLCVSFQPAVARHGARRLPNRTKPPALASRERLADSRQGVERTLASILRLCATRAPRR